MTTGNLGFVSPYLLRPLRSERQAALEIDPSHPIPCPRCGQLIAADCEPDGCQDLDCPRLFSPEDSHRDQWEGE